MANPNIVNVSSIYGKTTQTSLTTTSATSVLSNAASSGKVFKINMIMVANIDGSNAAAVTINYNSAAAGAGTNLAIASTVAVPADATMIILDKNTALYLEENKSIVATAATANDLVVTISYEEIS